MTRGAILLLLLLAFGALRLPIESALAQQHRSAHFHEAELGLGLREQIGQLGFLAALSGFRSLVADVVFIRAHVAWERTQWGRVLLLFREATTLQPRSILFWDMAAWHMAWNASVAALHDPAQPNDLLRRRARVDSATPFPEASLRIRNPRACNLRFVKATPILRVALGKDFLERGIKNNPDRPKLYESLARLYKEKLNNHAAAARCYAKAAALPGAPEYDKRFAAYELSSAPGQEREAHKALRSLYDRGEHERLPTLLTRLKFLEHELNIPLDQRIAEPAK